MQLLKRKNYNVLINLTSLNKNKGYIFTRLHIHKTGSLRLQVASDITLDRNGDCIVNLEGSVAKDLY